MRLCPKSHAVKKLSEEHWTTLTLIGCHIGYIEERVGTDKKND